MKSLILLAVLCWASTVSSSYQRTWCRTINVDKATYSPRRRYFWKGYSVTYTCNNGYQMQGKAKLTCLQGIGWDAAAPTCVLPSSSPAGCDRPEAPANGNIKPYNQQHFYEGDKIWFTCDAGYEIPDGEKKDVTCLSSGWSHGTPDCIKVPTGCGKPAEPENGGLKPDKTSYDVDDKVWYFCDAGYTLNKNDKKDIVCKSNGQWSHGPPRCEADEVSCGRPARVSYASYKPYASSYKPSSTVTYKCRYGYNLVGSAESTCQDDGSWTPAPSCSIITCSKPDIPEGGDIRPNKETYRRNERVYFRCNKGYTRTGASYARCLLGKWSATAFCTAIQCDALEAPENGSIDLEQDAYDVHDVITFSCDDGFVLVGSSTSTCRENTKWSNKVPTCQSNTCNPLTAPINGELSPDQDEYQVEETIVFTCDEGYELMGAEEVVCQDNGDWSDVEPTCEAVTCDGLTAPDNGQQSTNNQKYRIGEQVDFSCDDGFFLDGSEQLECLAEGVWSDVEPTCQRKYLLPQILT
uniref:Sushi, von Willebrand factor type A, EGF and pentraxin domain-containing protein 1-like n=1 Tax=Phallusia mammillata TaxID=59560 RepID=A0A6F9DUT6_9ASCI|nr:sushi, von Willebrand factor type A, EGF and pentraxin domain-containing protein 1-like [Phallusia mammillata]